MRSRRRTSCIQQSDTAKCRRRRRTPPRRFCTVDKFEVTSRGDPKLLHYKSSPSLVLAGEPHDVDYFSRGRLFGLHIQPDKTLFLPNHILQNLVHCEWTSRSESGLRAGSRPNFNRRSVLTNENAEMPKVHPLGLPLEAEVQRTWPPKELRWQHF